MCLVCQLGWGCIEEATGVLMLLSAFSSLLRMSVVAQRSEPIYLGRDPWHGGVDCYLDEVKIYNRRVAASDLLVHTVVNLPCVRFALPRT